MDDTRPDATEVLPRTLFSRHSTRRASVFSDLMTIFRRSTSGSFVNRNKNNYARRPSIKDLKNESNQETEAFLGADTSATAATGANGHGEEEEEGKPMTRQVLLNKIRQKKEVIGKLRCQAWSMNRKRRTLKLAQKYLEQHESRVSKTHLYKEEFKKRWHATCRWADNIRIYLIPWEAKIKRIESHFGSVVSSYFTFLRWVVYVNLIITLIIISFIVIPEVIADATADAGRKNRTESRKVIPFKERIHADELQVVLHFGGYFKYSPLFYGYYSDDEFIRASVRYSVPLAYFVITLFIFGYSFFAILRKMAANARMSKLASGKTEQYTFNWKVFTGWDYTIGNPDAASNTAMAIVIKLRESIADCRIVTQKKFRILLFLTRIFANAVILGMLAFSIYVISFAVQSSQTVEKTGSLFTKNQVPTIVATITHLFPMIFDLIGTIERYHPRTALRAHLTRVLVLYVVNYLTLIIALFEKLDTIRENEVMKFDDIRHRARRHFEDLNVTLPLSTFESRNFTTLSEAINFMNDSIQRFTEEQQQSSAKPTTLTTTKTRRDTTKLSTPIQRSTTTRKSPHSRIVIQPQYGPIGLNNPSALLFNATLSPYNRRYQTIKIGPTPLPIFKPPPTPRRPSLKTNINLELGPDWRAYGKRPKSTPTSKTTTSRYRPSTAKTNRPKTKTTAATTTTTTTTTQPPKKITAKLIPNTTSTTPITTNVPIVTTLPKSTEQPKISITTALPSLSSESAPPTPSNTSIINLNSSTDLSFPANKTKHSSDLNSTQHSNLLSKLQSDNITLIKSLSMAEEAQNEVQYENVLDKPVKQTLSDSNVTLSDTSKIGVRENISSVDTSLTNSLNATPSIATQTTSPSSTTVQLHGLVSDKQKTDKIITTAATSTHSLGKTTSDKSHPDADEDLSLSKADAKLDESKQFGRHEQKDNGREMIILSPDEDLMDISNNVSLISVVNSLGNDTYYEIGSLARITTEEAEVDDNFCWETMIGQEIVKLVTMDLVITVASIFVIDFFRGLWIKYCSSWWCWDIETTFPEYGEFKVAENVLHIIYNQGLIWIGLFFSPLLPAINNIKLIILLYIRGWACMTCNVPAREIFRASRSSNFYLLILLLWLLLCTLPVGYVIASKRPSFRCGPFAGYDRFYNVFTHMLEGRLDEKVVNWLHYMASPGVIIPVLLLLMLVIYFLVSLVRGLKEANNDLQQQLIHERTEEKKKIFELAGGGNKRKPNELGRTEKKKKVVTYLPIVEQKRREPWRAFNGLEYDSSVCVTDETSTVTTPASNAPSPQIPLRTILALPPQTTSKQVISSAQQPTSFGSLDENDVEKRNVECAEMNEYQSKPRSVSKSISLAKSNTTDRVDDWFNDDDEGTKSDYSYSVQEDAVQLATPEELRRLIRPLRASRNGSSHTLSTSFPVKDTDTGSLTVLFPTISGSRHSIQRYSHASLYENPSDDYSVASASTRKLSTLLPRVDTCGSIRLHESVLTGSSSKIRPYNICQAQPSTHLHHQQSSLDPIIAADREKEIEEECFIDEALTKRDQQQETERRAETHRKASVSFSKKFDPKLMTTDFVPWPSMDEMKEKRRKQSLNLQAPATSSSNTSSRPSRRISPPKSKPIKTIEGSPTREEASVMPSQRRRFRISVSPTRRLHTDPSGSDTDTSTGKRRYVIKQQVMPGSTSSVFTTADMTQPTGSTSIAGSTNTVTLISPRAPRVQFGDDDSPRVEQKLEIEPKVHSTPLKQ